MKRRIVIRLPNPKKVEARAEGGVMTITFIRTEDRIPLVIPDSRIESWSIETAPDFLSIVCTEGISDLLINLDQILMIEE